MKSNYLNSPLIHLLKTRLSVMHPSYFAMSMATGIVAIAGHLLGLEELALVLTWVNIIIFPILWVLLIARIILFPKNVIADFSNHERAPGFFTVVVSTSVIGTQIELIYKWFAIAEVLWWANLILWILCTYYVFTALTIQTKKPTLGEGINGGWLIAIVATQSVCVLGCSLGAEMLGDRNFTLFFLMSFWLVGIMLYIWTSALIFYRYMFFPISPNDLMPPYWINMGAAAISALAGALLAHAVESSELLNHFHPFILGLSIMLWATASWWIPLLLVLGIWKHYTRHVPITYNPLYWGLVFPFGMYARCTFQLFKALQMPSLLWVAKASAIAGACAWLITFLGLSRRMLNTPLFISQNMDPTLLTTPINELVKNGNKLVNAGLIISLIGIIIYCFVSFDSDLFQKLNNALLINSATSITSIWIAIGLGILLWLTGSLIHLRGALAKDSVRADF